MKRRHFSALLPLVVGAGLRPAWGQASTPAVAELERAARAEGKLASVGMPDDWANWRATWADLKRLYGMWTPT
jgi:putative spermidine/putrescine transport system substrate-binding protein